MNTPDGAELAARPLPTDGSPIDGERSVIPGVGQVLLRLHDLEVRRHARAKALLFGVEPLFGELPRRDGRLHVVDVVADVHCRVGDVGDDADLDPVQFGFHLTDLQLGPRRVRPHGAEPERIAQRHRDAPRRIVEPEQRIQRAAVGGRVRADDRRVEWKR